MLATRTIVAEGNDETNADEVISFEELAVPCFDVMEPQVLVAAYHALVAVQRGCVTFRTAVSCLLPAPACTWSDCGSRCLPAQHVFDYALEVWAPLGVLV